MRVRLLAPFFTVTVLLAQKPEQLFGAWKITTEITSASIVGPDTLEGKRLILTPKKVTFGNESCPAVYQTSKESIQELAGQARVRVEDLRILPDPIVSIDTACIQIFYRQTNEIVVYSSGIFYEAVREKPKTPSASKDAKGSR